MSSIQALRTLTRQRFFVLALMFALLSAQMLGLGHAIGHGLHHGSAADFQLVVSDRHGSNNPVDLHHSCAAYDAATVASVLTHVLLPLAISQLSFSACAPLVAHAYLPRHTSVFESRAPPRA